MLLAIRFLAAHAERITSPHLVDLPAQQCLLHAEGFSLGLVHGLDRVHVRLAHIARLFFDDRGGGAGAARVVQDERAFKLGGDPVFHAQRIDQHVVRIAELHEVEAAKGSGVLVLLAAVKAQVDALDLVREMRDVVFAHGNIQVLGEGLHHRDDHRRGCTQAASRRCIAIGSDRDGDGLVAHKVMDDAIINTSMQSQLVVCRNLRRQIEGLICILIGSDEAYPAVRRWGYGRICVEVDRYIQDRSTKLVAVRRYIGPTTRQS